MFAVRGKGPGVEEGSYIMVMVKKRTWRRRTTELHQVADPQAPLSPPPIVKPSRWNEAQRPRIPVSPSLHGFEDLRDSLRGLD